jgi:hypothetical protein
VVAGEEAAEFQSSFGMRHALKSWLQSGRRSRLVAKWILIQRRQRPYSSLSHEENIETLKVVCGSSGTIDVEYVSIYFQVPFIFYLFKFGKALSIFSIKKPFSSHAPPLADHPF